MKIDVLTKIFDKKYGIEFHLGEDYKKTTPIYQKQYVNFISSEYFIAHRVCLKNSVLFLCDNKSYFKTENSNIHIFDYPLLAQHELFSAKLLDKTKTFPIKINEKIDSINFKRSLLEMEKNWCVKFLNCIHSHLENRLSDKTKLTAHDLIRIKIANIVEEIQNARVLIDTMMRNESELYLSNIANHLRCAFEMLSKLAGGRAMLKGNVIEALNIFELINNIYCSDNSIKGH